MKRRESLKTSVRPPKIAFLISDLDSADHAIEYSSFIWGGKDNLLIPADQINSKFWMNALRLYDPDYVVYPENSQENLELPIQPLDYYKFNDLFHNGKTTYKCGALLAANVSPRKLAQPLHISEGKAQYLKLPPGKKLPLPLRAQLGGGFSPLLTNRLGSRSLDSLDLPKNPLSKLLKLEQKLNPGAISRSSPRIISPLMVTSVWYEKTTSRGIEGVIIITGTGENIEDLCLFWDLNVFYSGKNMPSRLLWLPLDKLQENLDIFAENFTDGFLTLTAAQRGITITSASLSADELENLKRKIEQRFRAKDIIDKLGEKPSFSDDRKIIEIRSCNSGVLPRIWNISSNTQTSSVDLDADTPINFKGPEWFTEGHQISFIVDINFINQIYPPSSTISRVIFPNQSARVNLRGGCSIKVTWGELSTHPSKTKLRSSKMLKPNQVKFHPPTDFELLCSVINDRSDLTKQELGISEKGEYAQGLIDLLGGLDSCGVLKDGIFLEKVIKEMARKEKSPLKNYPYHKLAKMCKRSPKDDDMRNNIEKLVRDGALLRGYELKCPYCGNRAWYHIDEVTDFVLCKGCRQEKIFIPIDEKFSYQANELLRRSWNEGVISHITTAFQLDETTDHKLHYIPGYKIGQEHEIDIAFILDGRLGIAECKRRGESLNVTEVKDYLGEKGIAAKIGAELIVFSCLDTFPDEIKEKIRSLSTQIHATVDIIELEILPSNS